MSEGKNEQGNSRKSRILATSRFLLPRWWVLLVALAIYIVANSFKLDLVSDLFGLSEIKSPEYFNVIIDATASVFGILIAVILLSFELVKHSLFKKAGANILNNPTVTNFLSLAVATILFGFISYSTITDFKDSRSLSVGYFIGYLFVLFILSVYPVTKKLLYSTSGFMSALKQIKRLKVEDFDLINFDSNSISMLEDNSTPLFLIRTELILMVRENDFQGYNWLLGSLNGKVMELQGDGRNRRQMAKIQRGLTLVWKGANLEALRVGNHQYFDSVWDSILSLYVNAIDGKHSYLHYQEIDFYQKDFISFLSRNNLNDNLASGARMLSHVFRFSLEENCPKQELLHDLYRSFEIPGVDIRNSDAHLQWDDIIDFSSDLFRIQKIAVENKDKDLYKSCSMEISLLISRLYQREFPNLKQLQTAFLLTHMIRYKISNAEFALSNSLFERVFDVLNVDDYLMKEAIEKKEIYGRRIIQLYGNFIVEMHKLKKLDFFITLGEWKSIAILSVKFYNSNEIAKNAIHYIIGTLENIKKEIEKNQLPERKDEYEDLKKSFEYLKRTLSEVKGTEEVCEKLISIIDSFKKVKKSKNGIIRWGKGLP